jgi:hypothetical protein
MGTATSKLTALGVAGFVLAASGCGTLSQPTGHAGLPGGKTRRRAPAAHPRSGFTWLRPRRAPAGWRVVGIPSGAAISLPPRWRLTSGDAGTVTAVLPSRTQNYFGYLNLTPRQGRETLTNWSSFRVVHNADEGDRQVRTLAVGRELRFRNGHGSCVRDSYLTSSGARYIEIACLVAGSRTAAVIVGAAPPRAWARVSPSIQRAISAVIT